MSEQINRIEKDVSEIKDALLGNEFNKNGIVSRVEKIEKYQNVDRKMKWIAVGMASVVGFIYKIMYG